MVSPIVPSYLTCPVDREETYAALRADQLLIHTCGSYLVMRSGRLRIATTIERTREQARVRPVGLKDPWFYTSMTAHQHDRLLASGRHNLLMTNFFNALIQQMGTINVSATSAVSKAGLVFQLGGGQATKPYSLSITADYPANLMLGTDTTTVTNRQMYSLVAAITHSAPAVGSYSSTSTNNTVQAKTWDKYTQIIVPLTFAGGATSGNPTIGEIMFFVQTVNQVPAYTSCSLSRIAVADGAFTAFTITSSLALLLNQALNFPT